MFLILLRCYLHVEVTKKPHISRDAGSGLEIPVTCFSQAPKKGRQVVAKQVVAKALREDMLNLENMEQCLMIFLCKDFFFFFFCNK